MTAVGDKIGDKVTGGGVEGPQLMATPRTTAFQLADTFAPPKTPRLAQYIQPMPAGAQKLVTEITNRAAAQGPVTRSSSRLAAIATEKHRKENLVGQGKAHREWCSPTRRHSHVHPTMSTATTHQWKNTSTPYSATRSDQWLQVREAGYQGCQPRCGPGHAQDQRHSISDDLC